MSGNIIHYTQGDGITCSKCRRIWPISMTRCPNDGRVLRPERTLTPRLDTPKNEWPIKVKAEDRK